ncbi:MAG: alcohol dehydrogenase catalytic domain-containing protein [Prevotellaceae bacterium]|jgi:threonine dehydrogenase-like Zn-dependent dehydrogenase|nr:alcohol dehydrogenase catalytic domain-containing protein [Prevotellaceae bacterium]
MKTMRAQVLMEPHKLELHEVAIPAINENEVLIKVKYCGICGSDWGAYTGKYADEAALLPLTTGHEFWGEIEETGSRVKKFKKGDRVAADICLTCGTCYYCRRGDRLLCETFTQIGIHTAGAFAEYVKVPWENCYILPESVDDYSAAFIEPLTACLHGAKAMELKIASSIVIIGCGLGIIHGALAKLRGAAPVIIVGDNPERLHTAKQMCADYVINIRETPDAVAEVMKLTGGIGADYVLEAVGTSATYEQAFKMLRKGGKLEAFGICADNDYARIPPVQFVLQEKKVSGSCAGIGNDWEDAIRLLQYNRIDPRPLISMIVPLEELEPALKELRTNPKLVKVLVAPGIKERIILY